MRNLIFVVVLGALVGCRQQPVENPGDFLDSLFTQATTFREGGFVYRLNHLPLDYFLARELEREESRGVGRDSLSRKVAREFGGGTFFLLRIGLDSGGRESSYAMAELARKMLQLQVNQEAGRQDITGHLRDRETVHPDLYVAQSDWIAKDGISILFCFQGRRPEDLARIEFGKSLVKTRNLDVDFRELTPKFRLKG